MHRNPDHEKETCLIPPSDSASSNKCLNTTGLHQEFIDLLPDPVFFKRMDGVYLACNTAFENLMGVPRGEIAGKSDGDIFAPVFAQLNRRHHARLVQEKLAKLQYDGILAAKGGSRREVVIQLSLFRASDVECVFGILQDITERKRNEISLREKKNQLHSIADNMLDLVSEADQQGFFRYLSPSHQSVLGFAPESLLNTWLYDLMHPEDLERMRIVFQDMLPALETVKSQFRYRHSKGYYIWLETIAKCTRDSLNRITGAVFASRDITERKRAEMALVSGKEQFRWVADNMLDLVSTADQNGSFTYLSPSHREVLGFSPETLIGTCLYDLMHPEDLERMRTAFQETLPEKKKVREEFRYRHADGHYVWLETIGKCITEGLRVTGAVFASRDVSERRRASEALREVNQTLQATIQASPLAIFVLDTQGRIQLWNPASQQMFGWTEQEVLNQDYPLVPIGLESEFSRNLERMNRGERFYAQETRRRHKDGKLLDISFSTAPLCDPKGDIIGTVGVLADITERKRTEIALRESEQLFRSIFEQNEDPAFLFNPTNLAILDANTAATRLYGYSKEELLGGGLAMLMKPKILAAFAQKLSAQKEDSNREMVWGSDSPLHTLDSRGDRIIVTFRGRLLRSRGQQYLYGTFRDITEKLRIRKEQAELQAKLIQANKMTAIGTLASGIAHEINNPNNYLLSSAQYLEEAWPDIQRLLQEPTANRPDLTFGGLPADEALKDIPQLLHSLIEGSRRIQNIVTSLRDFSRQDDGSAHRPCDINRIIEEALIILGNKIRQNTDHFACNLAEGLPPVLGHFQKIEQVVINLIINALQALPDRQAGVFVSTIFQEKPRSILVRVRDQGVGISPDIRGRILDPFFTTRQKTGGTGLGLSICYSIIKDHQATIDFDSQVGVGTVVTVTFPAL